ncbi:uncharacterized membrane protein (DUF4010 family) [Halomonas campaniensis]|uniref:Uncharacterized membrane protein (DUF4010 family) n=1 Tax=Halomonas campaniensis TaxID=213554 RepID=A0A7W5K544_9GAMM|nr:MgtC/SapB family protein [Halomonas campaniensis]MBB3332085.1 uncharacterized membrane protein (DUF4010 family) [Halomonas campaniensis]
MAIATRTVHPEGRAATAAGTAMDDVASQFIAANQTAIELAVALMLGALIGIERGWVAREQKSGERIAGIRTHALVGLLGGIAALLTEALVAWAFPLLFLAVAAIGLVAWRARVTEHRDYSITGLIGLLLTFCFGAIAVAIDLALATACAVITAVILDNKREIHGLLNKLQAHELDAGLKLLMITVVMLPLLPNQGMGPGAVLNPYEIWWMVVLIAAISFVGYFAIRVGGPEKGILFTGLFAGLSSSTALTLHFARQSRRTPELDALLSAGILLACGTMFPRILIYAAVIHPALLPRLLLPTLVMGALLYLPALLIWRRHRLAARVERPTPIQNPLELRTALLFGALLALIMLLGEWLREWLGQAGIYLLAAASGLADVDAITLSLTRMSLERIDAPTAVLGIVIAAAVNNLVKAGLAAGFGTPRTGWRVGGPMLASLAAGLALAWGL